ncbi:hypothetical protein F3Y22_tig00116951pilonHSYRG00769 [Hibiscus syriacus]|uniref:Uncharacterized protein n=1 Tax=Hibiscus syriacus TaxID=106335 RepID=A0A6A2WLD4_HIBSY|nr:hypothetical protein F3Y22_tig00116951pilonHSYRG00769 [Hibiscus syriacus]
MLARIILAMTTLTILLFILLLLLMTRGRRGIGYHRIVTVSLTIIDIFSDIMIAVIILFTASVIFLHCRSQVARPAGFTATTFFRAEELFERIHYKG